MSNAPPYSVSVAGVAFDANGRVLLIKRRDNGLWQAPGGILEIGETFEEGVAREVLEETGVQVEVQELTGVYKNISRGVVALVYRCAAVPGHERETAESSEVGWFTLEEALSRLEPVFAARVADAVPAQRASGPASRTHDGARFISSNGFA